MLKKILLLFFMLSVEVLQASSDGIVGTWLLKAQGRTKHMVLDKVNRWGNGNGRIVNPVLSYSVPTEFTYTYHNNKIEISHRVEQSHSGPFTVNFKLKPTSDGMLQGRFKNSFGDKERITLTRVEPDSDDDVSLISYTDIVGDSSEDSEDFGYDSTESEDVDDD